LSYGPTTPYYTMWFSYRPRT